ncbi:hypothetical protein CCR94_15125 [Rhodoblastus sphagnicola]|uniref:Uncharacterized protein n=1 Tax=Rhodoblastus sphagnicola TaxID=333368 RepID=A0A2S6N4L8_9HYPH|nr:hypothetical protein [Rhodoblastus sphagnicola]MBB4196385.1 arylsulfatase A-like enzyme [Rhodoblastus sphagnicola]PPQ29550.1 hypothetical protein CCR94_15125 [Rhodoblastus sphagnicola]
MIQIQDHSDRAALASSLTLPLAIVPPAAAFENNLKHVLLVSIDGFRAADLQYCIAHNTCSNLAGLAQSGVIYTGGSKHAEDGGFNEDDTHVALIGSNPGLTAKSINTVVTTAQIAPTILQIFGVAPSKLDGVRAEGTQILPGLQFGAR